MSGGDCGGLGCIRGGDIEVRSQGIQVGTLGCSIPTGQWHIAAKTDPVKDAPCEYGWQDGQKADLAGPLGCDKESYWPWGDLEGQEEE